MAAQVATPADIPDWLRDESTPSAPAKEAPTPEAVPEVPAEVNSEPTTPAPTPNIPTPTPTPASTDADIPDWLRGAESEVPEETSARTEEVTTPEVTEAPIETPTEVKVATVTNTDDDIPDWLKGADIVQTEAAVEAVPTPETIADVPLSKTPEPTP